MKSNEEILKNTNIWDYRRYGVVDSAIVKLKDCGSCTCIWSHNEDGYEHVSVASTRQFRMPSWDDMAQLKDMFFDAEEECYQIMPKHSEYVNLKTNCLHIWRPVNGRLIRELVQQEVPNERR